jgi:adenosylhomocysteine nucleosidase
MNRIGIVAALPSELRPLTRHWHHHSRIAAGHIGPLDAVATCAGMGEPAVLRACERLLHVPPPENPIDTLVSVGYAGSLSCGLSAPLAVTVGAVIDARTGETFPTDPLADSVPLPSGQLKPQRLVTLDHVANPNEKRQLAAAWQATLVDMEAVTVARFARANNLRFLCFKAVTDGPNDELPDFGRFTGPNGRLRTTAFAAWAAVHPQYWRVLSELERNSRAASHELTKLLLANFASPAPSGSVS